MRISEFILENIEPILVEWQAFARSIWPGGLDGSSTTRDHGEFILRAAARDMRSAQSSIEQAEKSRGEGRDGYTSMGLDGASGTHVAARVHSGFNLEAVVSEYRALRASVLRLWHESVPSPSTHDIADITRFNEAIDQSLTESVHTYIAMVDRSRQMFLAILGHDLRNPLTSVIMSAEMISEAGQLDAKYTALANLIFTSGNAMSGMIADLLVFTESGLNGAMPLSRERSDLQGVCQEVVDETRAAHPKREIQFHSEGNLVGDWDTARLRQMLSNLLGNAIQHGSATAPIRLVIDADGSDIRVTVHNEGEPIGPEILPSVFDPLIRGTYAEVAGPRRVGSIGLGLYIAREVVTAHGGTIDVTSSSEEGTMFNIRLPRSRAGEQAEVARLERR